MWCDKDSHPATNDSTKLAVLLFQLTAWTKKLASMLPAFIQLTCFNDRDTCAEFSNSSQSTAFVRSLKAYRINETNNWDWAQGFIMDSIWLTLFGHLCDLSLFQIYYYKNLQASFQTPEACRTSSIFCQIPQTCRYPGCFVLTCGLILTLFALIYLHFKKHINIQRRRKTK